MDNDLQKRIDAFYEGLFEDPDFQAEVRKILDELVHKHIILGEPFDPPWKSHDASS